jgi:cysteine desulfurase
VNSQNPIYIDYHAHAPIDPRVVDALTRATVEFDANPHSAHEHGERALQAVNGGRREVAELLRVEPSEVVFVSGATEANNLAIWGATANVRKAGTARILVGAGEHPSVISAANAIPQALVRMVPLKSDGLVDLDALDALLTEGADLVSIAGANHEIGTIQPIGDISRRVHEAGALFHSDLAQCAGKIDIEASAIDLASVSAHKLGGPLGIGAFIVRRRLRRKILPLIVGGGQEGGLRAGTLAPALCVAFGTACSIANDEMAREALAVARLRDDLLARLSNVGGLAVNGGGPRLPGNLNVSFDGVDGEALVLRVRNRISLSTGSACTSAALTPSHVLAAIGIGGRRAEGAIRFGLGRFTTQAEVAETARVVTEAVLALRATLRRVA